jgi:hypothetical protein
LAPQPQTLELHTDEHTDYPLALRHLPHLQVVHRTISSRASRTPSNPLWPINLLDMLIRHSGANHKRETVAHSKRRQSAADRLFVFKVWRNYHKWFSERRRDETPAMRLGLATRRTSISEILKQRLFPTRIEMPRRWQDYYWRRVPTRMYPRIQQHELKYAV